MYIFIDMFQSSHV